MFYTICYIFTTTLFVVNIGVASNSAQSILRHRWRLFECIKKSIGTNAKTSSSIFLTGHLRPELSDGRCMTGPKKSFYLQYIITLKNYKMFTYFQCTSTPNAAYVPASKKPPISNAPDSICPPTIYKMLKIHLVHKPDILKARIFKVIATSVKVSFWP